MDKFAEKTHKILEEYECIKTGHFHLKAGDHSPNYCDLKELSQNSRAMFDICKIISNKIMDTINQLDFMRIDTVVGPACGAISEAYQISLFLDKDNSFAEKVDGKLQFKRGTKKISGKNVLVVEDVVTTGSTIEELIKLVEECGGHVVLVASIVDRSKGKAHFGVPFISSITLDFPNYSPNECPLCAEGKIPLVKLGSK